MRSARSSVYLAGIESSAEPADSAVEKLVMGAHTGQAHSVVQDKVPKGCPPRRLERVQDVGSIMHGDVA